MRILVTGACGYQGSMLVPLLLDNGYKVRALDTQWFGNYLIKHKNLEIIKKNVLEISKKDFKNIDIVINLAAIANDPMSDLSPNLTWEISCIGSKKLIELSIQSGVKKFIHASSSSVYGVKKERKVTEDLSQEPISLYNKAKMITERTLLSYKKDINIYIIRPATVCGLSPRMRFDLSVNMLCYQAIYNKIITVHGGKQIRPNIHILDLLNLYLFFIKKKNKPTGIYNAGFENLSILKISKKVQSRIPCKIKINRNINDIRSYRVDSTKLLKIGFKPNYSVDYAINEIYEKYKNKPKTNKSFFSIQWMIDNKKRFSLN